MGPYAMLRKRYAIANPKICNKRKSNFEFKKLNFHIL